MLRDDGEALRARLDAMERELAHAQEEVAKLRPDAERYEQAEASIAEREKEIFELRAKLAPSRHAAMRVGGVMLVLSLVGLIGVTLWFQHQLDDARLDLATQLAQQQAAAAADRSAQDAQLAEVRAQLEVAEAHAHELEQQAAQAQGALTREQMIEGELRRAHTFVARTIQSDSVRVTGRSDLGSSCTVALSSTDGDCRARVTCGDIEIYPAPGDGGYFSCEVEDGRLVRGADVNPTPVSGDPTLDVDGRRGVVTVTDGPNPAWSARIQIGPLQ